MPPPPRGCASAALFAALLGDRGDEPLLRRALRSRVDLRVPHGLLLVCGVDCDPVALGRLIAGRVPRGVSVAGAVEEPRHAAVVVPAPVQRIWTHALAVASAEAGARAGLVVPRAPQAGLRALRSAYFAALADAAVAVTLDLAGPLVAEGELVIPRMLAALPAADQEILLAPLRPVLDLPAHHRDAYIRTLDTLHHHGGTVLRAAEVLHLHPNTVRYRIARLEEMTGLRLDDPRDRLRLDLATTLVRLRGLPPRGDDDFGLSFRQAPESTGPRLLAA